MYIYLYIHIFSTLATGLNNNKKIKATSALSDFFCFLKGPEPASPSRHQVHPHQTQSIRRGGLDPIQPERPTVLAHWPEATGQRALSRQQGKAVNQTETV